MTASVLPPAVTAADDNRPGALVIGSVLGAAGGAMVVLTLLGIYLAERGRWLAEHIDEEGVVEPWLNANIIPLTMPSTMAGTLGLSAVTMLWAVHAVRRDDRTNSLIALIITAVLGVAVINGSAFLWATSGLAVRESAQALLLYSVMGAHLVMVGLGTGALVLLAIRLIGASAPSRDEEAVTAISIFWLVTTAVYIILWYAVYITK